MMKRTWKPVAAGLIELVLGTGNIVAAILLSHILIFLLTFAVTGVVSLLGGISALRRRIWWLATIGAICSMWGVAPLGALALWYLLDSKKEFDI